MTFCHSTLEIHSYENEQNLYDVCDLFTVMKFIFIMGDILLLHNYVIEKNE